jgi:periplasmic copper chaperone A
MRKWFCLVFPLLAACGMNKDSTPITVENAWVRPTVPGQDTSAAYMRLRSRDAARLIKITSASADTVQLHRSTMENGIMRMEPLASLDLPAGKTVELAPSGLHLMLMGIKKPLTAGERVSFSLTIASPEKTVSEVEVAANVMKINPAQDR